MTPRNRLVVACITMSALATSCGGSSGDAEPGRDESGSGSGAPHSRSTVDVLPGEESETAAGESFGLATIVVAGVTYEFSGEGCVAEKSTKPGASTFVVRGSGTVDGEQFGGSIARDELDIDGDGIVDVLHTLKIEFGGTTVLSQAPAGHKSLELFETEDEGSQSIVYEPGRLSGRAVLIDRNSVLAPSSEELPFTFVAACA